MREQAREQSLRVETLVRCIAITLGTTVMLALGVVPAAASAECPNEAVRNVEPYGSALADCRAYEQVSPVNKNGGDALGVPYLTEASPSGEGVVYFSLLPFSGVEGAADFPTYLSSFAAGGWSTQGLLPPSNPTSITGVLGLTEDLHYAIVEVGSAGPLLGETSIQGEEGTVEAPVPGDRNSYIRNNATGEYRLLAPGGHVFFDGSSLDDSAILFEDRAKLTKQATSFRFPNPGEEYEKGTNLYEWKNGVVTLAGVLPNKEAPAEGSVAGAGGNAVTEEDYEVQYPRERPGGATSSIDTQNTISENGSRVFFTDVETGQIYMREPATPSTVEVSSGDKPAYFRAATPSGSYVFYTEGEGANRNLYRFVVEGDKREALTTGEAHVAGTLGVSDDGSYVYFVALGVLATNENGHVINEETGEKEKAEAERDNLYEWHNGELRFIAQLKFSSPDSTDWTDFNTGNGGAAEGLKSSRVTPDGATVLFSSVAKITNYDNNNQNELYLYDADQPLSSSNPACVSCAQNIPQAAKWAFLGFHLTIGAIPRNVYLPNNLSSAGTRVFFQTNLLGLASSSRPKKPWCRVTRTARWTYMSGSAKAAVRARLPPRRTATAVYT
jgi:hypothetical protein